MSAIRSRSAGAPRASSTDRHSLADELEWLDAEGPTSSGARRLHHPSTRADYDFWIFFSYRYYHAYHGARAAAPRAVLVPTAERDPAVGLSIFQPIFRGVQSAHVQLAGRARDDSGASPAIRMCPSSWSASGRTCQPNPQPARFRQKFNRPRTVCDLCRPHRREQGLQGAVRVLPALSAGWRRAGSRWFWSATRSCPIPNHPRIRHLGFLDDSDKFDAMAASELLIMPSYFESLSMVALEAWALGKPVLANAKCDVLKGQCIRSNAGLYYDNRRVRRNPARHRTQPLAQRVLGRNGRHFFREHYDWPVIERKYLEMLDRLSKEPAPDRMEPLPGWLGRRKSDCPPSAELVAALPAGPDLGARRASAGARDRRGEPAATDDRANASPPVRIRNLHPRQPGRGHSTPQGGTA